MFALLGTLQTGAPMTKLGVNPQSSSVVIGLVVFKREFRRSVDDGAVQNVEAGAAMLVVNGQSTFLNPKPGFRLFPIVWAGAVEGDEGAHIDAINDNASHAARKVFITTDEIQIVIGDIVRVDGEVHPDIGDGLMFVTAASPKKNGDNQDEQSEFPKFFHGYSGLFLTALIEMALMPSNEILVYLE